MQKDRKKKNKKTPQLWNSGRNVHQNRIKKCLSPGKVIIRYQVIFGALPRGLVIHVALGNLNPTAFVPSTSLKGRCSPVTSVSQRAS